MKTIPPSLAVDPAPGFSDAESVKRTIVSAFLTMPPWRGLKEVTTIRALLTIGTPGGPYLRDLEVAPFAQYVPSSLTR